jgi:crotonobetainyl-CoA:carnitine CoA-transferase CaiB-like acyl-CoA transferase
LRPILAAWCEGFSADCLLEVLHEAGIPAGAVMNIAELATDAHLEARDMLLKLPLNETTEILVPGCPIHMDGVARPLAQRAVNIIICICRGRVYFVRYSNAQDVYRSCKSQTAKIVV